MKLVITVSGGRSSGYAAIKMFKEYQGKYDMRFVFANTGLEHPKTLEFLENMRTFHHLPIIYLETKIGRVGEKTTYKVVSFKNLSRKGEPFEEMVKKYGLPRPGYPHCNRELKVYPMQSFANDIGAQCTTLGIRYDELHRYHPKTNLIYPMVELFHTTKREVLEWWSKQVYDLEIPHHLGNCVACWKKRGALDKVKEDMPNAFDFIRKIEKKYDPENKTPMFYGYLNSEKGLSDGFGSTAEPENAFDCSLMCESTEATLFS